MQILYDILMNLGRFLMRLIPIESQPHSKWKKYVYAQRNVMAEIRQTSFPTNKQRIWFHAASLGEYSVIKPIIEHFKNKVL